MTKYYNIKKLSINTFEQRFSSVKNVWTYKSSTNVQTFVL